MQRLHDVQCHGCQAIHFDVRSIIDINTQSIAYQQQVLDVQRQQAAVSVKPNVHFHLWKQCAQIQHRDTESNQWAQIQTWQDGAQCGRTGWKGGAKEHAIRLSDF
jgi:hypothetical protein